MDEKGRTATIGMFDGVHIGHRFLLDKVRQESGGRPYVITFPNHPLSLISPENSPRLLMTVEEKLTALEELGFRPVFLNFDAALREKTAVEFLSDLRSYMGISKLVVGFNNRLGCDHKLYDELVEIGRNIGVEVIGVPEYSQKVSSSIIREAIERGEVDEAGMLLGRPYSIAGTVSNGNHIGRTLGFPTANLALNDDSKILPAKGVYAADAELENGKRYRAVVNIGNRPTVDNTPEVHIEAFLDGFEGNLYGQQLRLHFLRRLRDERRFPDMESLRQAIADDLNNARNI